MYYLSGPCVDKKYTLVDMYIVLFDCVLLRCQFVTALGYTDSAGVTWARHLLFVCSCHEYIYLTCIPNTVVTVINADNKIRTFDRICSVEHWIVGFEFYMHF